MRRAIVGAALAALVAQGCRCGGTVRNVKPTISVSPVAIDFGEVKTGQTAELPLKITAASRAELSISQVTLESGDAPGGAEAFELSDVPQSVPELSDAAMRVRFTPSALQAYEAAVVIASNDEEHPNLRVKLSGVGAKPQMVVIPQCEAQSNCQGQVQVAPDPLEIRFADEPFARQLKPDPTTLPLVIVKNDGPVELLVSKIAIEGGDASAFGFVRPPQIPAGGLSVEPNGGFNLTLQFQPTSEQQIDYQSTLVVEGDDPDNERVTVALKGKLRPNLPPRVCANLVRVEPPPDRDAPRDYSSPAHWASLLTPPPGGYDFSSSRIVEPRDLVTFSAHSSSNVTDCTSDPEDGRAGLTYAWRLTRFPSGSTAPTLQQTLPHEARLRAFATGEYEAELEVSDVQGHTTKVSMRFVVAIRDDLVAQLSWNAGDGGVDLDLHVIRPSSTTPVVNPLFNGAFSFFAPGTKTSGDINGYATSVVRAQSGAGYNFDWGDAQLLRDDPRLNLDNTGNTLPFVENVSLDYPENDPLCATGPCTYKVMVHYFADHRAAASAPPCTVDGGPDCQDGDRCDCPPPLRCVANASPANGPTRGAGSCIAQPTATLRIFTYGNPTPAAEIPLPPDQVTLGAPCHMLYLADVVWPRRGDDAGTPVVISRATDAGFPVARFGQRAAGQQTICLPNDNQDGVGWYAEEPQR